MTPMVDAAIAALREIFSPPFRAVLAKSVGMTLLMLGLAWAALDKFALSFIATSHPWLHTALTYATGAALFFALAFFLAPISLLIAGFFLDDLADVVEADLYPPEKRGHALPATQAALMGLRFAVVSGVVNFFALLLLLVPGVNAVIFFIANAWLFGREYFLFAATRFLPVKDAYALRQRFTPQLFFAGLFIAAFVVTPGLNVLTPLFGVAFMSRIYKMLATARTDARF
ncbi:MAG: sulfate transporter family protein [Methylocystis sp.]|nr:sulfate transporter family protein [Methylocystis sp.]